MRSHVVSHGYQLVPREPFLVLNIVLQIKNAYDHTVLTNAREVGDIPKIKWRKLII